MTQSQELYFLSPKGEKTPLVSSEVEEEAPCDRRQEEMLTRLYSFSNKATLDKFLLWVDEALRPRIEEGLSEVEIDINAAALEARIFGPRIEVTSMPTPTIAWAKRDIGKFKIVDS